MAHFGDGRVKIGQGFLCIQRPDVDEMALEHQDNIFYRIDEIIFYGVHPVDVFFCVVLQRIDTRARIEYVGKLLDCVHELFCNGLIVFVQNFFDALHQFRGLFVNECQKIPDDEVLISCELIPADFVKLTFQPFFGNAIHILIINLLLCFKKEHITAF